MFFKNNDTRVYVTRSIRRLKSALLSHPVCDKQRVLIAPRRLCKVTIVRQDRNLNESLARVPDQALPVIQDKMIFNEINALHTSTEIIGQLASKIKIHLLAHSIPFKCYKNLSSLFIVWTLPTCVTPRLHPVPSCPWQRVTEWNARQIPNTGWPQITSTQKHTIVFNSGGMLLLSASYLLCLNKPVSIQQPKIGANLLTNQHR